jgi:hypothetical protein
MIVINLIMVNLRMDLADCIQWIDICKEDSNEERRICESIARFRLRIPHCPGSGGT